MAAKIPPDTNSKNSMVSFNNWPSLNRPINGNTIKNVKNSPKTENSFFQNMKMFAEKATEKCIFLGEDESKQRITKVESEQLRNSVLRTNRPRNPWNSSNCPGPASHTSTASSSSGCSTLSSFDRLSSSSPSPPMQSPRQVPMEQIAKSEGRDQKGSDHYSHLEVNAAQTINTKSMKKHEQKFTSKISNRQKVEKLEIGHKQNQPINKLCTKSTDLDNLLDECARATRQNMKFLEQLEFEDLNRRGRIERHRTANNKEIPTYQQSQITNEYDNRSNAFCHAPAFQYMADNITTPPSIPRQTNECSTTDEAPAIIDKIHISEESTCQTNKCDKQEKKSSVPDKMPSCHICCKLIPNSFIQLLGVYLHPECFHCAVCLRPLDGYPFIFEEGISTLCFSCYERNFPSCATCSKPINSTNGQLIRVVSNGKEYHLECYRCEGCGIRLSNEENNRCYPIGQHLLCETCHNKWKKFGGLNDTISDL